MEILKLKCGINGTTSDQCGFKASQAGGLPNVSEEGGYN